MNPILKQMNTIHKSFILQSPDKRDSISLHEIAFRPHPDVLAHGLIEVSPLLDHQLESYTFIEFDELGDPQHTTVYFRQWNVKETAAAYWKLLIGFGYKRIQ